MKDKKIELLAPAGSWDALTAAVENGADAVYLGSKLFNARQYAENFDELQMRKALDYAHIRGVKIYLAMNTLLSDDEIKQAVDYLEDIYVWGADGLIVQDIGLAAAVRKIYPKMDLHASTQMTIYNLEGVRQLESMGFKRVVLARELSLKEISEITANTSMEIEVFAHGALCICYSGQCLMSSIIGGRSGNRGKCAQPCRLPYEFKRSDRYNAEIKIADGKGSYKLRESALTQDKKYYLSPGDLSTLNILKELIDSGIKSLKIEGRMKSPEYVATVTGMYRKYIDKILYSGKDNGKINTSVDKNDEKELMQIFNRGGFTTGYLQGKHGKDMMCFEKPKNWGVYLGDVISYDRAAKAISVKLYDNISMGDGIEVWNGRDENPGTVVTYIKAGGKTVDTAIAGTTAVLGDITGKIFKGNRIYKTSDKSLVNRARASFSGKPKRKVPLIAKIAIKSGVPVELVIEDPDGNTASVYGSLLPEVAVNKPLSEERVRMQLDKTGDTSFSISDMHMEIEPGITVPVSELNDIRRRCLEKLEDLRVASFRREMSNENEEAKISVLHFPGNSRNRSPQEKISIFLYKWRNDINYNALGIDRLYIPVSVLISGESGPLELFDNKKYEIFIWIPSVTRGNYDRYIRENFKKILDKSVDGMLIGNAGELSRLRDMVTIKLAGDHSLNIYNSFSLREARMAGLSSVTMSLEMSLDQLAGISYDGDITRELVVYGRLPLMTSEYCPVGSISGGVYKDRKCSGECSRNSYKLIDRMGVSFPVLCDKIDCRSVILNSNKLFLGADFGKIKSLKADYLRLNIWDESPEDIEELVDLHRDMLGNTAEALRKHAGIVERIKSEGFTRGHYFRGV